MVRPLTSVSTARVSLIVSTAHRTALTADFRCASTPIGRLCTACGFRMRRKIPGLRSSPMLKPRIVLALAACAVAAALSAQAPATAQKLDADAEKWVAATLKKMTLDDKVGQLLVSSFGSEFMSTDSREYEALVKSIHEYQIGGFHVFGGTEAVPDVLLDNNYGSVTLGQPFAAASILNRLQAIAPYPLLNSADFETGAGFRLKGATGFPRNMAFGAAGDEKLAYEAGRITAIESRAIGVQVNFGPVVDVNNNPRNPVINTRSYGEDPELVGRF